MKKAYTIIEVLVVMSIITVLMTLALLGLTELRRVLDADQATKDILSQIKETKNFAKNNNVSQETNRKNLINRQYGYRLQFIDGTIKRSLCNKEFSANWSSAICTTPIDLKLSSYKNIRLQQANANCNTVIFENLTEKVEFLQNNIISNIETCVIEIRLIDTDTKYRDLVFNRINGEYSVRP